MSPRRPIRFLAAALMLAALCVLAPYARVKVESEIAPPEKRKGSVDKAAEIAHRVAVEPVAPDVGDPFAPPGFDLTDAEEAAAAAAAARQAALLNAATSPGGAPTDKQLLEAIVSKIMPLGSIYVGGKPLLMFGKKFVKPGSRFTVTYKGVDYELELTDVDASSFTLRYNREEITRPIKSGKTP